MLTTIFAKPVMALLAISLLSIAPTMNKTKSKSSVACTGDIEVINNTDDEITKVIAESDIDYQDLDIIDKFTSQQITGFTWGTGFDLTIRFAIQPTVGNVIKLFKGSTQIDCITIQNGVFIYSFTGLTDCDDYTIVYEAGPC